MIILKKIAEEMVSNLKYMRKPTVDNKELGIEIKKLISKIMEILVQNQSGPAENTLMILAHTFKNQNL